MAAELETVPRARIRTTSVTDAEAPSRRLFEEALGAGRLHVTKEVLTRSHACRVVGMPDLGPGRAGFDRFVARLRRSLFGLEVTVHEVAVHDGEVAVRWSARGRQERPLLGRDPTYRPAPAGEDPGGSPMTVAAVTVFEVEGRWFRTSRTTWTSVDVE